MKTRKKRFALWINDESLDRVQEWYQKDDCRTQSEFIAKAIDFYTGYLVSKESDRYLPGVLASTLEGHLNLFGDRIAKLLFKLAVEQAVMMNIIAYDTNIGLDELDKLRGYCVKEIKRTNGMFSFRDALTFQKSV